MGKKLHIGVRVGRLGAQAIARAPAIIPYYLAIVNKKMGKFFNFPTLPLDKYKTNHQD